MNNINNYWKVRILKVLLSMLILLLPLVSSSGVSSSYWDQADNKNPLYILPGVSKDIQFILQNGGNTEEDVLFKVKILQGADIAAITDVNQEYLVPAKVTNVPVNVRISIPENIPLGTTYRVSFEFTSTPATEAGKLQFGSGFIQQFDVIVQEKPVEVPALAPESSKQKIPSWIIYSIIAIIIIILIIILIKRKSSHVPVQPVKSKS